MMVLSQTVTRILLFYNVWMLFTVDVFAFHGQLQFYPQGDQYLIVGSELRLNCSLKTNGTDFDLSKVYIRKGVLDLDDHVTLTRYNEDNVLRLIISNISVNDWGTYLCYYGRDEHVQSLTVVNVAEMPGQPENITCVSDRLLDMTCSFNLTKPATLPMKWRMEYRHNRKPPYPVNCSNVREYEVHCDTVPFNTLSKFTTYEVWVEGVPVNEKYKVNVSKSIEIYTNYSLGTWFRYLPSPYCYTLKYQIQREGSAAAMLSSNRYVMKTRWYPVFLQLSQQTRIPVASYVISVVAKHGRCTTFSLYRIHSDSLKPSRFGPVQDLNVTGGTYDAIIQWKRPKFASYISSLVYEYKVVLHSDWQSVIKYVAGSLDKVEKITVDGLIPYVNYTVTVWGRPTGADRDIYWSDPSIQILLTLPDGTYDGLIPYMDYTVWGRPNGTDRDIYWSDPSIQILLTLPHVPPYSVTMTTGSYSVSDCGSYMCAVLYWKNPDERYWFGEMVGYKILVEPESTMTPSFTLIHTRSIVSTTRHEQVVVVDRTGLHDYLRLNTSLLKSDGYSLTVSLLNTEGKSTNGTKVSIPDWHTGQSLQVSWVAVEMWSTADRISWEIDASLCARIVSVTIYWCIGQPGNTTYIQCKGNFDWHTFNVDDACKENVQQIPHNLTNTEDFKYGVSIATEETSGGIQWEKFRFKNSIDVPEKPLYSLDAEKTSIKVTILYNAYYVSDGGRPVIYHITYREKNDQRMDCKNDGTKIDMLADFSRPYHTIDDLESGTRYDICVWSSNDAGYSVIREPKTIETKEEWLVVIIVLAVVVPIILVGLISACLWCRAKRRRLIRDNKTVILPPSLDDFTVMGLTTGKDDSKQTCLDEDSGKGDSPLTSSFNGFLRQDGSSEEVMHESAVDVDDTDNLTLNAIGNHGNQVSPVLPGYSRYLNGRVDLDQIESMLEWQDGDSEGFESSGNVEDDVDGSINQSTPADSEYVDHDFPARKSTPPVPKMNSVSSVVHKTLPASTQQYLPHSHIDTGRQVTKHSHIDTGRQVTKSTDHSGPFSNVNHAYVDEHKIPVASKQSYESPIFSNRPEHFYYDIDEENDQKKSNDMTGSGNAADRTARTDMTGSGNAADRMERTDRPESEHACSVQIHKSTDGISVPQLDSYTVAYRAPHTGNHDDVSTCIDDEGISQHTGDSCKVHVDDNNEIIEQKPELDLITQSCNDSEVITETNLDDDAAIGESFIVDDVNSDEIIDTKYSTDSNVNSSADIFGSCSKDFQSGYKNPDSFSLGTGSTISDISDDGSIRSDTSNLENGSFSREMSPEIQSAKTAICHDIQTLVEPGDMTDDELMISEVENNPDNQKQGEDSSDKNSDSQYSTNSNDNSSANIFGISSKHVNSMYVNPDSFSLGGGSTISDVSDVESIRSENIENGSFSREMSPEKSAICQDIQTLTESNDKLPISKVQVKQDNKIQVKLDRSVNGVADHPGGDASETMSGETRLDSSDSYQMAVFASANHSGLDATPILGKHKIIKDNVNLVNEYTHF